MATRRTAGVFILLFFRIINTCKRDFCSFASGTEWNILFLAHRFCTRVSLWSSEPAAPFHVHLLFRLTDFVHAKRENVSLSAPLCFSKVEFEEECWRVFSLLDTLWGSILGVNMCVKIKSRLQGEKKASQENRVRDAEVKSRRWNHKLGSY